MTGLISRKFLQIRKYISLKFTEIRWLLVLVIAGLILLYGRYDWAQQVTQFSLRGYLNSAYMFILTISSTYFLLHVFFPQHKKWVWGLTITIAAFFSLPYRWLKLDRFYYYLNKPVVHNGLDFASLMTENPEYTGSPPPSANWLPGAWLRFNDMPYQILFFIILIFAGILVLAVCLKAAGKKAQDRTQTRRHIWFLFVIFLLILFQTYLHLSLRSPYTYKTHFERPPEQEYWYVHFMFPDNQGGVNADLWVFRGLEEHFLGTPHETPTFMIRRAFPFYISSQFSYFLGTYRTFLLMNIFIWFIACLCTYLLGRKWWKHEVGVYMAFLVGCGPAFIMFVAQPMPYLLGYAAIVIMIYLFERLLIDNSKPPLGHYLLFGCLFGLGSLVYDCFAWYVFFLLYGLLHRRSLKHLILSLGLAMAIYLGFDWLQAGVLNINMDRSNTEYITEALQNIYEMIVNGRIDSIYVLTLSFLGNYLNQLAHVFFVIPLILALCGIFLNQKRLQILTLLLVLPSLIHFAFLHYGGSYLSSLPRFNYSAYPAIYLMAAGMLAEGREYLTQKGWPKLGSLSVWITLVLVFVLSNIDAFGILPQLYYMIYYSSGGYF